MYYPNPELIVFELGTVLHEEALALLQVIMSQE